MSGAAPKQQRERASYRADERLIQLCLKGDTDAWSALIDKYKNLIYSIPIKLGLHQDANDIFQSVCVDLLFDLPRLREHRALPKWLIQTCYHRCLHHQRLAGRHVLVEPEILEEYPDTNHSGLSEQLFAQLEREQSVRDAILEMPLRCKQMIRMLFFELPARPYGEIAKELGLATGSIGFIRGRCLARLKKFLEKKGFS